ncbi:MAG: DNA mismatch repair protein MutL, partial [Clostridiales bacterium]
MQKIQVLSQQIANQIAAGEVVERPASIVKELVENAIDAGATTITVEIQEGGISYLRVTDNGAGIEADQVPVAFLRHATSKIASAADLDQIQTLGFRGEALASIAAVSKVSLTTRTQQAESGTNIVIHGGEVRSCQPAACAGGTSIEV